MNVIFVTNTFTPHVGGVARSIEAFSESLRERGHKVLVVAPEFPDTPAKEQDVIRVPAIQKFNASDFSLAMPLPMGLTEIGIEFGAQLVHSHHPFLLGSTAVRLARSLNLPLVFTHHTLYEQYTHYVVKDNGLVGKLIIELATGYANLAERVIAPSESLKDLLLERGVTTAIDVIPTGVQTAKFRADGARFRRDLGIAPSAHVIGHMGRLAPEKNIAFLAQAVAEFMQERPETIFLLVGKGPCEQDVRNIFADHQLSDRLVACGQLEGERLAAALNAMDVFAFTSLSETQGMVLTEAMAAGVPVVALDASGVREVVEDYYNGRLLSERNDVKEYCAALEWVYSRDEQDRRRLVTNAKNTAERFSLQHSTDLLLNCYQSLPAKEYDRYGINDPLGLEPLMSRLKTEWEILNNYTRAGGKAFRQTAPS